MADEPIPQDPGHDPEAEPSADRPPINHIKEAQRKQQAAEQEATNLREEMTRMSQTMSQVLQRMNGQPEPQPQQAYPELPPGFGQAPARPQYPQPLQQPVPQQGQNQNPQGAAYTSMQQMLRQMVDAELAPFREQQRQSAFNTQLQEAKKRITDTFGAPNTRPEFYDAIDREVSMRVAQHQLAGTVPLPSIYEDAAAVVATRWGSTPQRPQPQGGTQLPQGTGAPDRSPSPEPDADASEGPAVELTDRQKRFNEQLRAMGVDIKDEEVAAHMKSGASSIDTLYRMAQAGKGRIGRSARSVGR